MNELTQKEIKLVDKGDFGPWEFTKLTKYGNEFTMSFTNN